MQNEHYLKKKARILIVDDDPYSRLVLEGIVQSEGHEPLFAEDGPEALEKIAEFPPDCVLLDVMMPGMDGFEVCRLLKESEETRALPVILVTALNSLANLEKGFRAGADDFIEKPVRQQELSSRLRSMLRIKGQYDEIKEKNLKLAEAEKLREDISRMIVHDTHQPVGNIIALCDLLLMSGPDSGKIAKDIEKIRGQAERASSFLNELIVMAKQEEGRLTLRRSPVDLLDLLRESIAAIDPIAGAREISITLVSSLEAVERNVDADLFGRVIANLLSNAVKFSPRKVGIEVRCERNADGAVAIEVADEAEQVPREARERIFDKYEVVKLKKCGVTQHGLGLAFCKMVMDAHGGTIKCLPNMERGNIFRIELGRS